MGRPAIPSASIPAAVRAYFGLTQAELGRWLGVTRGQVAHAEAGRKGFSAAVWHRLTPLAVWLPPPIGGGAPEPLATTLESLIPIALPPAAAGLRTPPAPPTGLTAEEQAPLRVRLRRCEHEAATLRYELTAPDGAARVAAHWRAALPALLAGLSDGIPAGAPEPPAVARARRWLAARAATVAEVAERPATHPAHPATHALRQLRLALLDGEAHHLRAWLEG